MQIFTSGLAGGNIAGTGSARALSVSDSTMSKHIDQLKVIPLCITFISKPGKPVQEPETLHDCIFAGRPGHCQINQSYTKGLPKTHNISSGQSGSHHFRGA